MINPINNVMQTNYSYKTSFKAGIKEGILKDKLPQVFDSFTKSADSIPLIDLPSKASASLKQIGKLKALDGANIEADGKLIHYASGENPIHLDISVNPLDKTHIDNKEILDANNIVNTETNQLIHYTQDGNPVVIDDINPVDTDLPDADIDWQDILDLFT